MADNETIADIIAEKRRQADEIERDVAEKMKRNKMISDRYARELVADIRQEVDRIEAAWKRDTKELRVEIERLKEERNYSGVRERERLRAKGFAIVPKEQLERGDAAKLRGALEALLNLAYEVEDMNSDSGPRTSMPTKFVIDTAKSALSAPPRNCERFQTTKQAKEAYFAEVRRVFVWDGCETERLVDWLLAPATEKEGGAE